VSAAVQTNPPQITLSWPADSLATGYTLYRKAPDATNWGSGVTLASNATYFVDTNVLVGGSYEYRIAKSAASFFGVGYICSGIEAPLVESRGTVVLLVDNTETSSLALELARLQQDLVGDGWGVICHYVPRMAVDPANTDSSIWASRSNELANIKGLVLADFNGNPNVNSVLLFGHVPVPYSGDLAPDGHFYHTGAWPADAYYGDMHGKWTDSSVSDTNASDPRNWNVPGDGKFDQTTLPANVDLQVGRVDFANLPAFPQGETELLRQYLNKEHNFRHKLIAAQARGLIDDNFGLSTGTPFAWNGWANFAAFFGASNTFTGDWLSTLSTQSYLWGYGCGPGTYTSASGVATTTDLVTTDTEVVFTMLFGSYFGDWDSQNNLLRAQLGTTNYTLASAWAGQPNWFFHHMGLGESIGFSTRLTQNNKLTYWSDGYAGNIHIALMGEPTLRMHIVAPPSALLVTSNGSSGVSLHWTASPESVFGYYVYSAPTAAGPFTRLTTNFITGTTYTDPAGTTNVYMVRAVKLEVTGSGSYYNASQGIFQSLDGTAGTVVVNLFQPTNNAIFGVQPAIQLKADTLDPANSVTDVVFYASGAKIGEAKAAPYSLLWSNVLGGNYSVTARALCSSGISSTSSAVTIHVDNGGSPRLAIAHLAGAKFAISGDEVLGRTYHIQFLGDPSTTNWQSLGTATGNASGNFQFIDSNAVPRRFYRSSYP
jgi:hypothetical protein